jgi:uncharacterized repeat protein (TIGR03806 family)
VIISLYLLIAAFQPAQSEKARPLQKLSDYNFFVGDLASLAPAPGVIPYELQTALFSNYAEKTRFFKVPDGTKVIYNDSVALDFPLGTYLIKNFFYYNDFHSPAKGRRILETRLLVRTGDEWEAWPYLWNAEQTEAYYDVSGERLSVSYVNSQGKKVVSDYRTPNKNECKGCHSRNGKLVPLGPTARNLNRLHSPTDGPNQLAYWSTIGVLTGDVGGAPRLAASWNKKEDLNARARAYLDVNCGNCHSRQGPASTSGLFLDWKESDPAHLGIWKSPVAAGRGSGDFSYDIEPGKPARSILVYRMKVMDPGIAMPEIGREQVDAAGVQLISDWIKSMKK